jgi:hypothetical protein
LVVEARGYETDISAETIHYKVLVFFIAPSRVASLVEICSLHYPTRFALIAHLKYPGFEQRKEVKKLVLNVLLFAHLQEIHCCCQQKVCSVNGLIMRGLWSTKDITPSGRS